VAAVILPNSYRNNEIIDSKQLSKQKRNKLFTEIKKNAIDYSVIFITSEEVDKMNPKGASIYGMKKAIDELKTRPDVCLIDAEKLNTSYETKSIIKGDEKSISIAAASILAKVSRDRYMEAIDKQYPYFHFAKHKGYGTMEHLKALRKYGPIKQFHRFSYKPVKKVLETITNRKV
jgi:ribonuclease HII